MPSPLSIQSCKTGRSPQDTPNLQRVNSTDLFRQVEKYEEAKERASISYYLPDRNGKRITDTFRRTMQLFDPRALEIQNKICSALNKSQGSSVNDVKSYNAYLVIGSGNTVLAVSANPTMWPGNLPADIATCVESILKNDCATQYITGLLADATSRQTAKQGAIFIIGQILYLRYVFHGLPERSVEKKCDALGHRLQQIIAAGTELDDIIPVPKIGHGLPEEIACKFADAKALALIMDKKTKPQSIVYFAYKVIVGEDDQQYDSDKMPALTALLDSPYAQKRPEASRATLCVLLAALSRDLIDCPAEFYKACTVHITSRLAHRKRHDLLPAFFEFADQAPFKVNMLFEGTKHFFMAGCNEGVRRCIEQGANIQMRLDGYISITPALTGPSLLHLTAKLDHLSETRRCEMSNLLVLNGANPFLLASSASAADPFVDVNAVTPVNVVAFAAESGFAVLAEDLAKAQNDAVITRAEKIVQRAQEIAPLLHQALEACKKGQTIATLMAFWAIYGLSEKLHLEYDFGAMSEYTETMIRVLNQCRIYLEENGGIIGFNQEETSLPNNIHELGQKRISNTNSLKLNNDDQSYLLDALTEIKNNFEKTYADPKALPEPPDNAIEIAINNLTNFGRLELNYYGALEILVLKKKPRAIEIYMDSGVPISLTSLCRAFIFAVRKASPQPIVQKAPGISEEVQALISHATSPQSVLTLLHCAMLLRANPEALAILRNAKKEKLPFLHVARPDDAILLHHAIMMHPDVLSALMTALKTSTVQREWLTWTDQVGDNALFIAARRLDFTDEALFESAYASGVSLKETNVDGRSPVTEALYHGNDEALKFLLDKNKPLWVECIVKELTASHTVGACLKDSDANELPLFYELKQTKPGQTFIKQNAARIMMTAIETQRDDVAQAVFIQFKDVIKRSNDNLANLLQVVAKCNATKFFDLFATELSTEELRSMSQHKGYNDLLPETRAKMDALRNTLQTWRHVDAKPVEMKPDYDSDVSTALAPRRNRAREETPIKPKSADMKPACKSKVLTAPPLQHHRVKNATPMQNTPKFWADRVSQATCTRDRNAVIADFLKQDNCNTKTLNTEPNGVFSPEQRDCIDAGWAIIDALKKLPDSEKILGRHFARHQHLIKLPDLLQRIKCFNKYGASRWGKNDSIAILSALQRIQQSAAKRSDEETFLRKTQHITMSGVHGDGFVIENNQIYYFKNSQSLRFVTQLDTDGTIEVISFYPVPELNMTLLLVNEAYQQQISSENIFHV